jgi:TRAP-type C4-dicarboxylate transport system permease small subunit
MTLHRLSRTLDRIGCAVGALSCAVLFLLLIADIFLRKAGLSFHWSIEYSSFLMAFIVFFPLAGVTRRREHLLADFFIAAAGGAVEAFIRRWLIPGATLLFIAAIFWLAVDQTWTAWLDEERSTGPLRTPMWLPEAGMVIALAATLANAAIDLIAPQPPRQEGSR